MVRGKQVSGARRLSFRRKSLRNAFRQERADATQQTEQRLRRSTNRSCRPHARRSRLRLRLRRRSEMQYFARVEAEVVQLALAIAAKILHREAQVDPMLVATLVRMAVEKMREGSSVTVRVGAVRGSRWKQYFASEPNGTRVRGGRRRAAERSRLPAGDGAWNGELRIGYAVERSGAGILRSAGAEAGERMKPLSAGAVYASSGDGLDAALEGPPEPGCGQPD